MQDHEINIHEINLVRGSNATHVSCPLIFKTHQLIVPTNLLSTHYIHTT